jgi:hypothetical protein
MACLKQGGNTPSESERFTTFVMGMSRESRHRFRRNVGMMSRAQVESEDCIMAHRTSSTVAGENSDRVGGGGFEIGSSVEVTIGEKAADSLAILPLKKSRNEDARADAVVDDGKILGEVRERRESRHDQSFLGWLAQFEISD